MTTARHNFTYYNKHKTQQLCSVHRPFPLNKLIFYTTSKTDWFKTLSNAEKIALMSFLGNQMVPLWIGSVTLFYLYRPFKVKNNKKIQVFV